MSITEMSKEIARKSITVAENMQGVYDKGFADGLAQGGGDDRYYQLQFGEYIQHNGTRTDYQQAFRTWNNLKAAIRPLYDIKPTTAAYMFYATLGNADQTISLPELSKELGIVFDFSNCKDLRYAFSYAKVSDAGYVDLRNCDNAGVSCMFLGSHDVETAHLRIPDDGMLDIGATSFNYSYGMKNLTIEGVIGKNFNIKESSKLTADSIRNIIDCLDGSTTGRTVSFSKKAVNTAFSIDIDDETTYPDDSEWYQLMQSKSNWTFNFA